MAQEKMKNKKRLTPESTILLTLGGVSLAIIVYRLIYFIFTGT